MFLYKTDRISFSIVGKIVTIARDYFCINIEKGLITYFYIFI